MIKLTRLNNQIVVVNPDHIFAAESAPDTSLRLIGGERILVKESLDELVDLVVAFRSRVRDVASGITGVVAAMTERQDDDGPGRLASASRPPDRGVHRS